MSGKPNDGMSNNGMLSDYVKDNMLWVLCPCLTGIPNDRMPIDGIPNNGISSTLRISHIIR